MPNSLKSALIAAGLAKPEPLEPDEVTIMYRGKLREDCDVGAGYLPGYAARNNALNRSAAALSVDPEVLRVNERDERFWVEESKVVQ